MPNGNNSVAIEESVHNYTITSQKMLKKLGLKGDWINSISVEHTEFEEDGKILHGKRVRLQTRERSEV